MKPFISVVIPTYNRKDILERCLEHLLNQTYPSDGYEIIVIDDGSTDGTLELVMRVAACASSRVLISSEHINKGPATARNAGFKKSSGEIILFLDDDSFAERYLLEEIVNAFRSSSENIAAVRGRVKGLALDESKSEFIKSLDEYVYCAKRSWATNNLAYKKSVLEEVGGFDESFRQCEDLDLGARIIDKGYDQVYWDKALVWHLHETNLDMFKRKWMLGGMGLRVYFKKWLKRKPTRALMSFYFQIIKVGIKAFVSRNFLVKEQFKSTLKGFLFPKIQLKTKTKIPYQHLNNKPKYLLLTLEFPPFKGGMANYLFGLCNNLPGKNLQVIAPRVSNASSFDKTVDFEIKRVPMLRIGVKYATSTFTIFIFGFYTLITCFGQRISGIYCNHFIPLGMLGYLMKKLIGIPYGLVFHGKDLIELPDKGIKKRLGMRLIKEAERLVVNSNYTKGELIKLDISSEKRIKVLHPGIELSKFNSQVQTQTLTDLSSIIKGRQVLLTVARLVPHKGIDMVLKSLKYVIAEVPNLVYLVVGEGKDRERLEEIGKAEGLNRHIIFLGKMAGEDIIKYYQICDLFIMPSRIIEKEAVEGFGITFLEANACGKPVIGGNSGGISDAIIDGVTGFLVDPCDPFMIAGKILELLTDKDLANRLGTNGKDSVERLFSWEKRSFQLENTLKLESQPRRFYSHSDKIENK